METGYRTCNKCGEVKELTQEFWHRSAQSSTGFNCVCKECKKKMDKPPVMSDAGMRIEFGQRYGVEPTANQLEAYKKWRKANRWAGVDYRG